MTRHQQAAAKEITPLSLKSTHCGANITVYPATLKMHCILVCFVLAMLQSCGYLINYYLIISQFVVYFLIYQLIYLLTHLFINHLFIILFM